MVLSQYERELEIRVKQALNSGCESIEEICRQAEGAFPTFVAACLERLGLAPGILSHESLGDPVLLDSPEPHPIDFDWRFNKSTAETLAEFIALSAHRIACFGTPTIFESLVRRQKETLLIDRNPFLFPTNNSICRSDITSDLSTFPAGTFDTVVIDAPWYNDHMLTWFGKALEILETGGRIIFTTFPRLTRPSAEFERSELFRNLESLGKISPLEIGAAYETPLFELETLRALGLPALHSWRRTDFLSLRVHTQRPFTVQKMATPQWHRFVVGKQVIAVKNDAPSEQIGPLEPLYEDGSFVLKSVSARDPMRNRINVWTSRNRCLRVRGTPHLLRFFSMIRGAASTEDVIAGTSQSESDRQALWAIWDALKIGAQDAVDHSQV